MLNAGYFFLIVRNSVWLHDCASLLICGWDILKKIVEKVIMQGHKDILEYKLIDTSFENGKQAKLA